MAIWMKTKFDRGMNMDIPHSPNIACAMYGFRELGAEIIPYHSLDEIYDKVQREDIVLDYILQCNEIFKKFAWNHMFLIIRKNLLNIWEEKYGKIRLIQ